MSSTDPIVPVARRKIVILGDSLPLPRPEEGVTFEHTYPYLLQERLRAEALVICRARRLNTTRDQVENRHIRDDVTNIDPDGVIVHIGIVDCAPRIFSRLQGQMVSAIRPRPVRDGFIRFCSRHRRSLTRIRRKQYVGPKEFDRNVARLLSSLGDRAIMLVGIAGTTAANKYRSYGLDEEIVRYNSILRRRAGEFGADLLDVYAEGPGLLLSDGIHLNRRGNEFIAAGVEHWLRGVLRTNSIHSEQP